MKKILLCVAIVSIVLFGYSTYADEDLSPTDTLVSDIIKTIPKLPLNEQLAKLQKYEQLIAEINTDEDSREILLDYIKNKENEVIEKQKGGLIKTTTNISTVNSPTETEINYETLANTNRDEIAQYWLGLHNTERAEKGLTPVVYDKNLEMSAYTRANVIRDEKRTVNFHKREKSDNNYSNYPSMKKRFADLGIVFNGEGTEFSENVGRGLYSYKNNNFTAEIKKQILKTFTRFMNEEKSNGAHYRAIVMPQFTRIGLGISLDPKTKKYYLVTHYSK